MPSEAMTRTHRIPPSSLRAASVLMSAAVVIAPLSACGDSSSDGSGGGFTGGCEIAFYGDLTPECSSECPNRTETPVGEGGILMCSTPCDSDNPCPSGSVCWRFGSDVPAESGVCHLECSGTCPEFAFCAPEGICRNDPSQGR
jgi:hypothetical protein